MTPTNIPRVMQPQICPYSRLEGRLTGIAGVVCLSRLGTALWASAPYGMRPMLGLWARAPINPRPGPMTTDLGMETNTNALFKQTPQVIGVPCSYYNIVNL
jgi:hypothetical protein